MNNHTNRKYRRRKKTAVAVSLSGFIISLVGSSSVVAADPTFNKLPDFVKKSLSQNSRIMKANVRRCPEPFLSTPKWGWTSTTGAPGTPPYKDNVDVGSFGSLATRPWGNMGINKTFVHTIKLRKPDPCCIGMPGFPAYLYLKGGTTQGHPNPFDGNQPGPGSGQDVLAFIEDGVSSSVQNMGLYPTLPAAPNWFATPGSWVYPVPNPVSATDGDLSFILGDDTNIHQTYLVAQFCCLPKDGKNPRNAAQLRANPNSFNQFKQLMDRDKGNGRVQPRKPVPGGAVLRGVPAPRVAQ